MIKGLTLRNFILVPETHIEFYENLQAITGETGAGKSILVGALNLVLGATLRGEIHRDKSKPAYLEAVFELVPTQSDWLTLCEQMGLDPEEELILVREISPQGKSFHYMNGRRVTASVIKECRQVLLDFHSQNDQQKLLDPDYQLEILDYYGKLEPFRNAFREQYLLVKQKEDLRYRLVKEESLRKDRMELYQYQLQELEQVNPQVGEEEELQQEFQLLTHAEAIIQLAGQGVQEIYEGDQALYDQISQLAMQCEQFSEAHPRMGEVAELLNETLQQMSSAVYALRSIQDSVQSDEGRRQEVESRLTQLRLLLDKYRCQDVMALLQYWSKISAEVENFGSNQVQIQELEKTIQREALQLQNKANELTQARKKAATAFVAQMEENIHLLAIPEGRVEIIFDKKTHSSSNFASVCDPYDESGQDVIEFYFSANRGMQVQPVKQVISGGELSRLLLAIKKILSSQLSPRVIVFDEIDAGIGGKTAEQLAFFIKEIGAHHQVLCITHLPQIASAAVHQFAIEKSPRETDTVMVVRELSMEERIREIARMMSGQITDTAIAHAKELIQKYEDRGGN